MTTFRRSRLRAFAAALAVLALATPQAAPAQTKPAPYVINVVLSLTGSAAFSAASHHETLVEFERYIDSHGGIRGRPIHFDFHDDESNPAVAVQITNGLLPSKPIVILGSGIVATCSAMAPLMVNGPVQYCISPGFFPKPGSNSFSASTSLDYLVPAVLRFMRDKGYKRLAVVSATDATGQSADHATLDGLRRPENKGITVVDYEHVSPADVSMSAQISNLKSARPDAVVAWVTGTPFGTVLRALNDAGLDVPVLTSAANMNRDQLAQYARFIPKRLYFNSFRFFDRAHIAPGPLKTNVDAFFDQFRKDGVKPSPDSSYAWDVGLIVVSALRDLGLNATPEALREYIFNIRSFVGINGVYDFATHDQHGLTDSAIIVVRWVPEKGDWVAVSTPFAKPLAHEP